MATPEGLKAEESDLRRRTVFVCVAASVGTEAQAQSFMEKQWRRVTCDQAVERLMGPDLLVTNRKDKEVQVQVLKNLNKQTAKFVTTFLTTLSGLPLPTAFDKFFAFGPLLDSAGDDVWSTLLGRVSFDEFSASGTLKDSALELVAERHRGHPRVSSSTREELEAFIRAAFAGPTAENLNTLFPVFDETLKMQHGGEVWSVCALPDGRLLTGSGDKFARVFSDTGAELFKMQHGGSVRSVCALPDGRLLTGSRDNFARVFSDTGAELFKMQHGGLVLSVCALPDGRLLTGSADNFASVFSDTGSELFKMQHGGLVSVRLRPSGWAPAHRFLRTTLRACSRTPEPNFSRCSTSALCCPCALDGRLLTFCGARVFSDTGAELFKMQHGGFVGSVGVRPDGRLLTGSQDNFARVFSDTGAELFKMKHGYWVRSVCALPDGRLLTGSADKFARVFSDT